jgi:hypothetical protein
LMCVLRPARTNVQSIAYLRGSIELHCFARFLFFENLLHAVVRSIIWRQAAVMPNGQTSRILV